MDKKQNLTSFQELTTTELNQITGGGLWEDLSQIIHTSLN
ncbi:peptide pheromone BlpC (bacteriocin-like peptide) [Streptococcus pneumoniae]|nr:peptide pheromone BlpC (bacteriocin-like peptide) [Streptococcus pneumoniae]